VYVCLYSLSVCLSVHLSVILRYWVEAAEVLHNSLSSLVCGVA